MWEASLWKRMSTKLLSRRGDVCTLALSQGAWARSLVPVRGHPAPTFQGGTVSYKGTMCTCERSLPLYIHVDTYTCICICTYVHTYTCQSVYMYLKSATQSNSSWQFGNFLMHKTCYLCHTSLDIVLYPQWPIQTERWFYWRLSGNLHFPLASLAFVGRKQPPKGWRHQAFVPEKSIGFLSQYSCSSPGFHH